MASKYDDRDYDRGARNYGRRSSSEYDRSGEERSRMRSRFDRDEGERYANEDRWRSGFGSSASGQSRPWRENEYGRNYSGSGIDWEGASDYSSEDRSQSRYGSSGRGYDIERQSDQSRTYGGESPRYGQGRQYGEGQYGQSRQYGESRYGQGSRSEGSDWRSQRYNYPSGYRTGETYGGHGAYEDYGSRYPGEQARGNDYDRGVEDRGWWDRASDEVASWFGDEDATRRRRMDQQRDEYRGRGPKNYKRSDDRIREDVNDRLSEGYLDASDIEVEVQNTEVVLTGTVNSRADKRRAEAVAESVTGVSNVENRLRVKQQNDYERYGTAGAGTELSGAASTSEAAGTTGITGTAGTTGTTGTTGTSSKRAGSST